MIIKVDDLLQFSSPLTERTPVSSHGSPTTSSQRNSPSKQGVSGGGGVSPCRAGSMEDVQSVGSSLGQSSHSSHSRHSHASSSRRQARTHRKSVERPTRTRGSGTPPCGREEKQSHVVVDKAEVASMYLDTKQNMLEIIEEGLHMKLELKNIKQQFLTLLENYDTYHQRVPPEPPAAMKAAAGVPLTDQPLSAPRARVRALYEARRARLSARRSAGASASAATTTPTPRRERRSLRDSNKENQARPTSTSGVLRDSNVIGCDQKYNRKLATSTPVCKPHKHCACHPRSTPGSSLLAPIKEEALRMRPPYGYTSGLNSGTTTSQTLSDLEGEYVTLRSPSGDAMEVSMEVDTSSYADSRGAASPGALCGTRQEVTSAQQDQTSIWINSNDNLDALHCPPLGLEDSNKENLCVNTPHQPARRRSSPVKYATSDVISELYTSRSLSNLKDVSQISRLSVSSQTLREQSSGSNISGGNLHSTFNYPLHSTLNYPLNSTLNLSPADDDAASLRAHHRNRMEEAQSRCFSDVRTTISEPSAVLRKRANSIIPRETTLRALDDSIVDIRSLQRSESRQTALSSTSERSRRNKSRTARTRRRERLKQREREAALTPVTTREPQLCKEHGLHPTFGGPCIFQTDDSFTMSETTTEDDDADDVRPRSSTAVTETDNDSSYLSECVDDSSSHLGPMSGGRAEDYTATYDARNGRMRMLRRQTGQTILDKQQLRDPIGLSESDFLMDVTRKHLSLEATRSSLPDLSALSTTTASEYDLDPEADVSEDTLHASQVMKDSDGFWSPNSMDDTIVSVGHTGAVSVQQRPLSISTSTTTSTTDNTSPESTESRDMPVPVNSPNVTDSGSSRPTTDTYDYVDVPKFEIMGPPAHLPARYHHHHQSALPPRRRHHHHPPPGVARPPCTVGRQASASSSSGEGDAVTDRESTARYETRSEGRGARKCLRYHHDYDSGFSTPGSGRRHILLSDAAGNTRTLVQHSAVARNLQHDRKKQLVKKIKQFSNNFYKSTGNLHIHTLGHF